MIDFASITPIMQLRIAEKLDYGDIEQLEQSSKQGKHLVSLLPHGPIVDINAICFHKDIIFIEVCKAGIIYKENWKNLKEISNLPRFVVRELTLYNCDSSQILRWIEELEAKITFVKSDIFLNRGVECDVFNKIAEVFNVTSFYTQDYPDEDLFHLEKFQQIDRITLPVDDIPTESLLKLKGSNLRLKANCSKLALDLMANAFFQEWLLDERSIEWLELSVPFDDESYDDEDDEDEEEDDEDEEDDGFNEDALFDEIEFSTLYHCESEIEGEKVQAYIGLSQAVEHKQMRALRKDDTLFSINRGDKKLVVFVCMDYTRIIAQECFLIDDVVDVFRLQK